MKLLDKGWNRDDPVFMKGKGKKRVVYYNVWRTVSKEDIAIAKRAKSQTPTPMKEVFESVRLKQKAKWEEKHGIIPPEEPRQS